MSPPKVLVAIHGIGDQTRYETLQHLVNLCFGHYQRPRGVPIGLLQRQQVGEDARAVPLG